MTPSPFASAPTQAAAYLAARGISESAAAEAGIRPVDAAAIRRGMWGPEDDSHSVPGDGLEIPYRNLDGSDMLGLDGVPFRRYRVFDTRTAKTMGEGFKPMRYMSAPGSGHRPYLPAGLSRLLDNAAPFLVITEGEIKALSAVTHGIACAAIGGVTLWHDPEQDNFDEATARTPVHPELVALAERVGRVIVLADSDAKTNDDVRRHMQLFTEALRLQAPSAVVCYARCPDPKAPEGKKLKPGAKQGLDDWLEDKGYASVSSMLQWHIQKALKDDAARREAGFKPLGFDDRGYYVWSVAKGSLEFVGKRDLTNSSILMSICRLDWCETTHPKATETGISVDWTRLGGQIAASCEALGPFDSDQLRGPGVWAHAHDQNVLVINSADVWRSDAAPIDRVTPEYVYPRHKDLGIAPDTPPASVEDVARILEALMTWSWVRPTDAHLMLGWIGLGYVAGALRWRPHLSLTGPRGSGKSTLLALARALLGRAAVYSEGSSTEAGIRQAVRSSAPALLLDEGEADGQHLARVLEFLRVASSGGSILKGTSDQQGARYTLRALGCIAGINPPAMQPADASRFLRLTLEKNDGATASAPHPLLDSYTGEAAELGLRLFARTIQAWPRYLRVVRCIRAHMRAGEARSLDTLSPAVAMAWTLRNDHEITDAEAAEYVAQIDLEDDFERISQASDADDLWGFLTTRAVQATASGASQKTTIGEMIMNAAAQRGKGAWARELGTYGMKVVPLGGSKYELRVNYSAVEFKGLLKDTKFGGAEMVDALRRIKGADQKCLRTDRFPGVVSPVRYVGIVMDIDPETTPGPVNPSKLD